MRTNITNLKKRTEGFTIIEVLIVLAIAGLIMLIVFLAVPALQRNTRNNSRKNDASRLSAAVNNYVSNNNGTLPANGAAWTTAGTGECAQIINDAGTLGQYVGLTCTSATQGANDFDIEAGAFGPATAQTANEAILVTGAQCATTNSTSAGSVRQAALIYDLETGSGNWNWACLNIE